MRQSRWSEAARLVLPVLAGGYAIATVLVLPFPGGPITTYATSPATAALLAATGLGLIASGTAAWWAQPAGAAGPLAIAAGVAWLAPVWVGWVNGPATARSLGAVVAPFLLPALAHLVLSRGRFAGRGFRTALAGGWAAAATASVGLALSRNPLHDLRCWRTCSDTNVFLVTSNVPVARALEQSWLWFSLLFGLAVVASAGWRLATASPAARARSWVVLVPATLALAGEAVYAGALLWYAPALLAEPAEPTYPALMAIFLVRGVALAASAGGLGLSVLRRQRQRAAVARLANELGAAPLPGSLQAALVASVGDPTLQVGYWLPTTNQWVDSAGGSLGPPKPGQATTEIHRGGRPVAVIRHDPALTDSPELAAQVGSAARVAIDNERLRAEALAQLEQVRAARVRIVTTSDAARRQLERDLHDGAQQRLLAVSYELRLARTQAQDDPVRQALLDRAAAEVRTALAELRELAHGIFPAILEQAGLGPALESLADTAAVPVELQPVPPERLPANVERTVYLLVAGAIEAARPDTRLHLAVTRRPEQLVVAVTGASDHPSQDLADRVGALGGRLITEAGRLRAEIPCG